MKTSSFCLLLIIHIFHSHLYSQTLLINEFEALNVSTITDITGGYDDWIEIINVSSQPINIDGYYLTDVLTQKTKCKLSADSSELTISAGGFLVLWADGEPQQGSKHLNFRLSGTGEQIGLFAPDLSLCDIITYTNQHPNASYGRDTSKLTVWHFYPTPTPESANTTLAVSGFTALPKFSSPSGIYSSPFQLTLTANPSDSIYYTLNNASPTDSSLIYKKPIAISSTQVVRAQSQHINWASSDISSQIYLMNVHSTLPILAIITDSLNLYGKTGIYTNYMQSGDAWERFCQVKYFVDGKLQTESNGGIRIQGNSSVFMPKKSFRLFFKNMYGNERWNYPFFGAEHVSRFDKLVLKSGYDDDLTISTGTLIRDALSVEIWKSMGYISTLSTWTSLYLNNKYWGIYNLRESVDEHFIKDHTGLVNFDLVRFGTPEGAELKYGSIDDWNKLYKFIKDSTFFDSTNYQKVAEQMDMDEFTTLLAYAQCTEYYSWAWGISMYRENTAPEKWKFSIWDTDRAYSDLIWNGFKEVQNTATYHWGNIFAKKMMQNAEFNRQYINRICDLINTAFKPEKVLPILDSIYAIVRPEINNELARWNPRFQDWEVNVEAVRNFIRKRPEVLIAQMKSYYSLTDQYAITVDVIGKGTIRVNQLRLNQFPWTGNYFENNAFEIEAIPAKDYHFVGWNQIETDTVAQKTVNLTNNESYTALFEPNTTSVTEPTRISDSFTIYPNPSNGQLTINYSLEKADRIEITLLTTDGKQISSLLGGNVSSGNHSLRINQADNGSSTIISGIYFVRLTTREEICYKKIILIK